MTRAEPPERACCQARAEGVPREIAEPGECFWPKTDCWVNGPAAPADDRSPAAGGAS